MRYETTVGKRDFIQHTSQYIKQAELNGSVVITHQNKPVLRLVRIEDKSIKDLKGTIDHLKIYGDINESEFPGYDKW